MLVGVSYERWNRMKCLSEKNHHGIRQELRRLCCSTSTCISSAFMHFAFRQVQEGSFIDSHCAHGFLAPAQTNANRWILHYLHCYYLSPVPTKREQDHHLGDQMFTLEVEKAVGGDSCTHIHRWISYNRCRSRITIFLRWWPFSYERTTTRRSSVVHDDLYLNSLDDLPPIDCSWACVSNTEKIQLQQMKLLLRDLNSRGCLPVVFFLEIY